MTLVYGSIVPHSPVLLPHVKEKTVGKLDGTIAALGKIRGRILEYKPDTLIVIAPHDETARNESSYLFHIPPVYRATFEQFGELTARSEYTPDPILADRLKDKLVQEGIAVTYSGSEKLEYSVGVPLEYLAKGLGCKILVVHPATKQLSALFEDGKQFQKILQESEKRIICLASGDLAHCLSHDAPLPFNPTGVELEQQIVKWIKGKREKKVVDLPAESYNEIGACGLPSFALFWGIITPMQHRTKFISYENPFGVGHIIMDYSLE
ncbi:hypothetical protein HYV71_03680 [Candidatus Uhrbacteria bacterium]|nr:hypothetical protein [Candidatus Uhrbacteria bacterium]